jgi:hypothetical protein
MENQIASQKRLAMTENGEALHLPLPLRQDKHVNGDGELTVIISCVDGMENQIAAQKRLAMTENGEALRLSLPLRQDKHVNGDGDLTVTISRSVRTAARSKVNGDDKT